MPQVSKVLLKEIVKILSANAKERNVKNGRPSLLATRTAMMSKMVKMIIDE